MKKLVFALVAGAALVLSGCAAGPTVIPAESLSSAQTPGASAPASETPTATEDAATPSESATTEAPATSDGTAENPLKMGATATVGDWTVTVVSVTKNATAKVVKANMFNAKPAKGFEYTMVNVKATYNGDKKGNLGMDLKFSFLGNDSTIYASYETGVVAPNDLSNTKQVVKGGKVSGSTVLAVPVAVMTAGGLLQVEELISFNGTPVNWKI
jgi:hypothetical protein